MKDPTLTAGPSDGDAEPVTFAPHLFVVASCAAPLDPPSRHCLAGIDRVAVSRGERSVTFGDRALELSLPDRWMSSNHAVLERQRGHWVIEDQGAKNGIRIDGERQQRAILLDGAVIELGHTFLVFREGLLVLDERDEPLGAGPGLSTLVPGLERMFREVAAVAASKTSVVIRGETGTGKELTARAVHELSGRTGAFTPVNCGALAANLIESELFGYRAGAFSGADKDRAGLVAASDGGTLFLDEIGELVPQAQAALLRVLEEGQVRPVGATAATEVDLRVVVATHRDLAAAVDAGDFRRDLLARLRGAEVVLPPLRERREDIGLIIGTLLERRDAIETAFTRDAMHALLGYGWPDNVRELAKCLDRALALAGGSEIRRAHLPAEVCEAPSRAGDAVVELSEQDAERRDRLEALLTEHAGNVSAVSREMGRARSQIQRWMKRYGLVAERFRT